MKISSMLQRLFGSPRCPESCMSDAGWWRDPLSHPALERMSQRDLGDLPFRRSARRTERELSGGRCGICAC